MKKKREKKEFVISRFAPLLFFDAIHFIEGAHMSHKKFFLLRP